MHVNRCEPKFSLSMYLCTSKMSWATRPRANSARLLFFFSSRVLIVSYDQVVQNSFALLGVTVPTYRHFMLRCCFFSPLCAFLVFLFRCYSCWDPNPPLQPPNPLPSTTRVYGALLVQACLSIFVTASKFDVSYSQLKASEPCTNKLTVYTKCLIKSAAAPGINIAGRLGTLAAENGGLYSEGHTRADPAPHKQTVAVC